MELFKRVLKEAVSQKAMRLQLQADNVPSLVTQKGPIQLTQAGAIPADTMWQLYQALFPKDQESIRKQQPTKGVMNVVGVGHVLLIAEPSPTPTLKLYLPDGHTMFEAAWAAVNPEATPAAASTAATATTPPAPPPRSIPVSPNMFTPPPPPAAPTPAPVEAAAIPEPEPIAPDMLAMPAVADAPSATEVPPPPVAEAVSESPPEINAQGMFKLADHSSLKALPAINAAVIPDNLAPINGDNLDVPAPGEALFAMAPPPPTPAPVSDAAVPAFTPAPVPVPTAAPAPVIAAPAPAESNQDYDIPFGDDPRKVAPVGVEFPINELLRDMVKRRASDLHLTAGEPVAMRIDGEIERVGSEPISIDRMRELLLPIMPPASKIEFYQDSDTDFAYEVAGAARFRVNIYRDRNGVGAVMRQIPSQVLTADQLGLSDAIRKFCTLTKGLVLVTGPTGSGKSTTLAAMVDLINKARSDHILTIEDPIEFVHQQQKCLVNQREVHRHTKSYARALRAALREDPDVVLIGEMRDLETVEIAIETAETGHLVFGTLHTNTAISTVDRIVDQFPSEQQAQIRVMMAESLKGVVSQTLLKKIGGGRAAAQEVLVVSKAIAALIREGKTHMIANQMQSQKADGNVVLNDALMNLVMKKVVTPQDAFVKAVDKDNFIAIAQQKGVDLSFLKKTSDAA